MNIKAKPKLQPIPSLKCTGCYYHDNPNCIPHRPYDCTKATVHGANRYIIFKEVKPNGN